MAHSGPADEFGSVSQLLYGVPVTPRIQGNAYNRMEENAYEVLQAMDKSLYKSSWGDNMKSFVRYKLNLRKTSGGLKGRTELKNEYDAAFKVNPGLGPTKYDADVHVGMLCIAYMKFTSDAEYVRHDEIAVLRGLIQLMCFDRNVYESLQLYHRQFWDPRQVQKQREVLARNPSELSWLDSNEAPPRPY